MGRKGFEGQRKRERVIIVISAIILLSPLTPAPPAAASSALMLSSDVSMGKCDNKGLLCCDYMNKEDKKKHEYQLQL